MTIAPTMKHGQVRGRSSAFDSMNTRDFFLLTNNDVSAVAIPESEGSEEAEEDVGASGDEEGSSQEGEDLSADDIIR